MSSTSPLRGIPSVERLLSTAEARALGASYARAAIADAIRDELEDLRHRLLSGDDRVIADDALMENVRRRLERHSQVLPRRVVNATGVVIHTNLGRAPLAAVAIAAAREAASTVALEYDLERGGRGDRDSLVEEDLLALTGAEAVTVVNNNAAAVLLAVNTLAAGREVIVSRGELVEIGGAFRMPDVLAHSGALLREVGTTNRTHRRDYENAIGADSGALLKVHASNYRVVGFTAEVSLAELVEIGRARGIPVIEDLGSGALIDLAAFGLPKEPVVRERIAAGADVVTFSGDKLLGGPQAGILAGKRAAIAAIKRNPLKRALRCDKLTLAALAATLRLYRHAPDLCAELPVLRLLCRPLDEIESVAKAAKALLEQRLDSQHQVEVVASAAEIGSGALPTSTLESRAIAITHTELGPDAIAARFRRARPPVIGRIEGGRFLLDLRAIESADELAVEIS